MRYRVRGEVVVEVMVVLVREEEVVMATAADEKERADTRRGQSAMPRQ
jgi:hypothetical protein